MIKKIGFIGVGVMGKSMVLNLKEAGYEVSIYTRTKSKAEELLDCGISWCPSVKECAREKQAIITMVGYPEDVEQVYFGEEGLINNANKGTYLIDMTTTDPSLSVRIAEFAEEKGLHSLDAPVSGGDTGAKNGTLSIMVGGKEEDFKACLPIFQVLGSNINYTGIAGSGQHTKMANQIAVAGAIAGVCEAIAYASENGLDLNNMLNCIRDGAAGSWQISNTAPRILADDMLPGFYINHFIKDLNIALANISNTRLDATKLVRDMYLKLAEDGLGDLGTQALIKYY